MNGIETVGVEEFGGSEGVGWRSRELTHILGRVSSSGAATGCPRRHRRLRHYSAMSVGLRDEGKERKRINDVPDVWYVIIGLITVIIH